LPSQTKAFVERYCDLKNLKEGAWYPSGDDEWQLRAPYVIIAGTWNSGVNHLAQALLKHPQIDSAKIHGFFLPRTFKKFISITAKATNINVGNTTALDATTEVSKVQVFAARDRMYHTIYSPSSLQDINDTAAVTTLEAGTTNGKHVAMDISPGLMFHSRTTSYSIQCVSPWTKTVVLLRNPIDRLYQQWVYSKLKLNFMLSLEDWVAREMKAMQSVGLIGGGQQQQQQNPGESSTSTSSEKEAWKRYQAVSRSGAPLGRSMYVLQLDDWIKAYLDAGKNPAQEMIIVSSEWLEGNQSREYTKVIDFLGLAPLNVTNDDAVVSSIVKPGPIQGVEPMTTETRSMLRQFFKPYNRRLTKLLNDNGFDGDWDKIWS
jgi:hypothetical protein